MLIVRPARAEEQAVLAELGLASWCKGIAPHVSGGVVARMQAENPFLPFLQALGANVLVAEYLGRPAGFGASENLDDAISDIWVGPAFEGRGAASALVGALEAAIRGRGFVEASIQVAAANNRAHDLYRHLGYREILRRLELDPILGVTLDKIELRKSL